MARPLVRTSTLLAPLRYLALPLALAACSPRGSLPADSGAVDTPTATIGESVRIATDPTVPVTVSQVGAAWSGDEVLVVALFPDPDGGRSRVLARRLGADGMPRDERVVNLSRAGSVLSGVNIRGVTARPGGGWVVAWSASSSIT